MVRILYLIDDLRDAGAQKHLVTLLSGLDRGSFQPYVVAVNMDGPCGNELRDAGVPVHACNLETIFCFKFFPTLSFLFRFIRKHKINIVQTYLLLADILGVLAGALARAKIITTRREMGFWNKKRIILTYRFLNFFTDRIVAVSNAVREFSLRQENITDPQKISVIYNGIDPEKFPREVDDSRERKELNIPGQDVVVIALVANLLPVKGHKFYIEAISMLESEKELPKTCTLLVGDGRLRSELQLMVKRQNLENRILFLGTRNDVADILQVADIFALPSLAEGMSNALIEAMLAGKPVITTNTGGNPEVVGSDGGIIVDPGDAVQLYQGLKTIVGQAELREKMSAEASARARKLFTADKMCHHYERLYYDLAAKN